MSSMLAVAAIICLTTAGAAGAAASQHPSGKDRLVEPGNSFPQGNAQSDPDDNGKGPDRSNGGADQPGGPGGVDKTDQDGNNGCGNDQDFEDDNEGLCRGRYRIAAQSSDVVGSNTTKNKTSASSQSAAPGGSVTTSSQGWAPGSSVNAVMRSKPRDLGTFPVSEDGTFTQRLEIPADAPAGAHTLTLSGTGSDGRARSDVLPLVITDAGAVSATTQAVPGLTVGAVALALLIATMGAGQLIRRQRRMRGGYGY